MPDLRETRRQLKIGMVALLAVDVVALGLLISPIIGSEASRRDQLSTLWKELQIKTREVEPLKGLDKKIPVARGEIDGFYKARFSSEQSDISADLGKLAQQSGVKISEIKYKEKAEDDLGAVRESQGIDPAQVGLRKIQIDAGFEGNYVQLIRFVNALERNHLFFLVDGVELGGRENGIVQLKMSLETYLKTGAA
jgi:type IV pilus assembly protein PilO